MTAADTALLTQSLHPQLIDYGLSIKRVREGYFNFTIGPNAARLARSSTPPKKHSSHSTASRRSRIWRITSWPAATGKMANRSPRFLIRRSPRWTCGQIRRWDRFLRPPATRSKSLPTTKSFWIAGRPTIWPSKACRSSRAIRSAFNISGPKVCTGSRPRSTVTLRLKAIAEMTGPAADGDLVPELKGLTDRKSIADWDPPFRFYPDRVRSRPPNDQDEQYWKRYKAMPKAFVSLECGRRLWSSRFGQTTSWRIPPRSGMTVENLAERLRDRSGRRRASNSCRSSNWRWKRHPARRRSTACFLGFSFFIIASAVMLVALLFKLGIDGQGSEIGLLLAIGFSRRRVRWLLLAEGLIVSLAGGIVGVIGGVFYAWLMLVGLRTIWLAAIVTPFLHLYATAGSLLEGFLIGVLVSLATIAWSLRQLRKISVRRLLAGETNPPVIDQALAKRSSALKYAIRRRVVAERRGS